MPIAGRRGIPPEPRVSVSAHPFGELCRAGSRITDCGEVSVKRVAPLLFLLLTCLGRAQTHGFEASVQQKFVSGGTIRLHLEAGGYTISPSDSNDIVVSYRARSEASLKQVKVAIKPTASIADIVISDTPTNDNFNAVIEVPRQSNLWVRLSAGELVIESVEGDKDLELRAGRMQVDIPHVEQYGHCDASVLAGSLEASAFDVVKGGLFRSFDHQGPGKYRLHAHITTGEIDLRGSD